MPATTPPSRPAPWPAELRPQLAMLSERTPTGSGWVHEIKFDGYRILARIKGRAVKLVSRNGLDWTAKFGQVAAALANLKSKTAILDGEVVVLDEQGRSDFQALQAMVKHHEKAKLAYYVFDLLYLDGQDLRPRPLIERKRRLERLLQSSRPPANILYSQHLQGDGRAVATQACRMGLEGIVSKRADAPYVSRRDPSWLKSKCDQRQEFVIIGYTDPQGGRTGFGALLLGYHDEQGRLVYGGRVGTGFDDRRLREMLKQLKAIAQKHPPTDIDPPRREMQAAHWVKPKLVGEVRFSGWTRDGVLRHAVFIALRSDKHPKQITRERAGAFDKPQTQAKTNGSRHLITQGERHGTTHLERLDQFRAGEHSHSA